MDDKEVDTGVFVSMVNHRKACHGALTDVWPHKYVAPVVRANLREIHWQCAVLRQVK